MLVDLRDVYWTPEGRWAVELSLTIIALAGAYLSGIPLWHGLREELTYHTPTLASRSRWRKARA
jgi:hypothetical protein